MQKVDSNPSGPPCVARPTPGLTIPDPALRAALDVVLDAAARHDLVTGIYAGSPENALILAQRGFRLVTAVQDTALLQAAVAAAGAQLRAGWA